MKKSCFVVVGKWGSLVDTLETVVASPEDFWAWAGDEAERKPFGPNYTCVTQLSSQGYCHVTVTCPPSREYVCHIVTASVTLEKNSVPPHYSSPLPSVNLKFSSFCHHGPCHPWVSFMSNLRNVYYHCHRSGHSFIHSGEIEV